MKNKKGCFGKPIKYKSGLVEWVGYNGKKIKEPKYWFCQHPEHKGDKKILLNNMYVQEWVLSQEEFEEVIEELDFGSLLVPPRLICEECYKKEVNKDIKKEVK